MNKSIIKQLGIFQLRQTKISTLLQNQLHLKNQKIQKIKINFFINISKNYIKIQSKQINNRKFIPAIIFFSFTSSYSSYSSRLPNMQQNHLSQSVKSDIKQLYKTQQISSLLINQIQQIYSQCLSVIVIYQKLFIKIKYKGTKGESIHYDQNDSSLYMIKINKSFPLQHSVRLYLLDASCQPKIFDTRDLIHQTLGQVWTYNNRLIQILEKLHLLESKLFKRNQNYLALQRTGEFLLGDIFVYNELEQHTSLSIFVDKNKENSNLLNAVSQTHFLTFKKVVKKLFKSKEEQQYENKSKTLYGKRFQLVRCCDLQCIESLQINNELKQATMNIIKYKTIKSFNEFETTIKKLMFNDEQAMNQFVRIVLKNLPKYQQTKISFLPTYSKPASTQSKQDQAIQKVIELNQLQSRLQSNAPIGSKGYLDPLKREELVNRLNKSYQKLIEYYSARANPYYLIYVNKLNWLYNKYFVGQSAKNSVKRSMSDSSDKQKEKTNQSNKSSKLIKSLTAQN